MTREACCQKEGCGKTWPRDPVLEVECPTCRARVGVKCRRPSEHRVFGGQPHAARDILADQQGHYGPCPRGCCGLVVKQTVRDQAAEPPAITAIPRDVPVTPAQLGLPL